MRRTPVYDPFDDQDEPRRVRPAPIRRISTTPDGERAPRPATLSPLRSPRRPPPRRGPDPRVWFVRASLGIAALAALWLGLQTLFPTAESQVSQAPAPAPTQPIDAPAVGAPEPPATAAQPAAAAPASQAAPEPEGDRLPGLPTPAPAQPAAQAQPAQPAAQNQPAAPQSAQPGAEPAQAEAQPAAPAPAEKPAAPDGTPTLAPIPPPEGSEAGAPAQPAPTQPEAVPPAPAQAAAPRPAPAQPAPAAKPQAAVKPQAPPPPPAQASGGPFELAASASPANPISEQAMVTISVRATQGGAPLAGASCMATIYYRTATARQPQGGFRTDANGVGSFVLDARGTTYGYYIPVDVTCSGRGGTVTARTGFTPVRGR